LVVHSQGGRRSGVDGEKGAGAVGMGYFLLSWAARGDYDKEHEVCQRRVGGNGARASWMN